MQSEKEGETTGQANQKKTKGRGGMMAAETLLWADFWKFMNVEIIFSKNQKKDREINKVRKDEKTQVSFDYKPWWLKTKKS